MKKIIIIGMILLSNAVLFGMVPCSTTLSSQALFKLAQLIGNGTIEKDKLQQLPQELRKLVEDILPLYTGRYTSAKEAGLNDYVQQTLNRLPTTVKQFSNYLICFLIQPPKNINELLLDALSQNNSPLVKAALEQGADVRYTVPESLSPLELLKSKALPGESALVLATRLGNEDIVRLLLARPNNQENYNKALSNAAQFGHDYLIPLLVDQGASFEFRDEGGLTPLHQAALRGQPTPGIPTLRAIEKGVSSIFALRTPDYEKAVQLLLNNNANINTRDNKGRTPLINAALANDAPMVRLLLDHGADKNITDNKGLTALAWAQRLNFEDIVRLLQNQ